MRKADKTRAKEERDREKLALKREKEAKAFAASQFLEVVFATRLTCRTTKEWI